MTFKNKVIALSATLAGLLLIYGAGILFSPDRVAASTESGKLLSGKAGDVASIELGGKGDAESAITLEKKGSGWVCVDSGVDLPVLDARVKSFIDALSAVDRLSERSQGGSEASFGLEAGKARSVLIKGQGGKILADFSAGGYDTTGKGLYVKLAGKEKIYAVDASFNSYLTGARSSWLDERLFTTPIKAEDVQRISLSSSLPTDSNGVALPRMAWTAQRKDGGWVPVASSSGGGAASGSYDAVAVESILRSVINLEGEDIVAQPPVSAFDKPLIRIELGLGSGGGRVVEIGSRIAPSGAAASGASSATASGSDGRYYLRAQGSSFVYAVSAYSLGNIVRPESQLRVKK
jgi:hypothetical protein